MNAALHILFRLALIAGGTLAVLVVGSIGIFWFFAPDLCGNEILADYPSPEATRRVVVFQRDCGATTGFSTQASVLGIEEELENESGNVFASDTNHGAAPAGPGGGPALSVSWQSENSVLLSFHPRTRVFKKEPEVSGVRMNYANTPNKALSTEERKDETVSMDSSDNSGVDRLCSVGACSRQPERSIEVLSVRA